MPIRKTQPVAGGDYVRVSQHNNLRDESRQSSYLMAYGDTTTTILKVLVNAGNAYFGTTIVEFAGGYSPVLSAPATSSRIDIVSLSLAGSLVVTAGTIATVPVAPATPSGNIPICQIWNRAGQTKITDEDDASNGYIYKDLRPWATKLKGLILKSSGEITGSLNLTGLKGNTAKLYKLRVHSRYINSTGFSIRLNNDSGNNYTYTVHEAGEYNNAANHIIVRNSGQSGITVPYGEWMNFYADITIFARSGGVRLVKIECVVYNNDDYFETHTIMGMWSNTADELTQINLVYLDIVDAGYYFFEEMTE